MVNITHLPAPILRLILQFVSSDTVALLYATHDRLLCSKLVAPDILPNLVFKSIQNGPNAHFIRSHRHLRTLSLGTLLNKTSAVVLESIQIPADIFPTSNPHSTAEALLNISGAHLLELKLDERFAFAPLKRATSAFSSVTFKSLFPSLKLLQVLSPRLSGLTYRDWILEQLYRALPETLDTLILQGVSSWPSLDALPPSLTSFICGRNAMISEASKRMDTVAFLQELDKRLPLLVNLELEFDSLMEDDMLNTAFNPLKYRSITLDSEIQGPQNPSLSSSAPPPSEASIAPLAPLEAQIFRHLDTLVLKSVSMTNAFILNRLWSLAPGIKNLALLGIHPSATAIYPPHLESLTLAGRGTLPLEAFNKFPPDLKELRLIRLQVGGTPQPYARRRRQAAPPNDSVVEWTHLLPQRLVQLELRSVQPAASLSQLPASLQQLRISGTTMDISVPISCPQLAVLRGDQLVIGRSEDIVNLPPTLEYLSIRGTNFNQHSLKALLEHLPSCRRVKILEGASFIGTLPPDSIICQKKDSSSIKFDFEDVLLATFKERLKDLELKWSVINSPPMATAVSQQLMAPNSSSSSTQSLHSEASAPTPTILHPNTTAVSLARHIAPHGIDSDYIGPFISKAKNLEVFVCMVGLAKRFNYSVFSEFYKLTTLWIASDSVFIDFNKLPRSLTDLKTRRLDLMPNARRTGPFLVGSYYRHIFDGQGGNELVRSVWRNRDESLIGSSGDDTLALNRLVSDLPRGLTRLNIATTMLKPQNDADWPPNLTELRFASLGWNEAQLLSLRNHLSHLSVGSIHGIVDYSGTLHNDAKSFELFNVESMVRASLAPLFIDVIKISKGIESLLPHSITSLSFAEFEKDLDFKIVDIFSPVQPTHYAVHRMMGLNPMRRVTAPRFAPGGSAEVFRVRVNISFDASILDQHFPQLTTLKIAMQDCTLAQLNLFPRTLTHLFIVSAIDSALDLVQALPPSLTALELLSQYSLYLDYVTLPLLPRGLKILRMDRLAFLPKDMDAFPPGISELQFDAQYLWIDLDILNLATQLDSDEVLKKLKISSATISGALLPSDLEYLCSITLIQLTNKSLGPKCHIEWSSLAAPIRIDHLTKLRELDFNSAVMTSVPRYLVQLPSVLQILKLRFCDTVYGADLVTFLPRPLRILHLLYECPDSIPPIKWDNFWSSLPRYLEELVIDGLLACKPLEDKAAFPLPTMFHPKFLPPHLMDCTMIENPILKRPESQPFTLDSMFGLPTKRLHTLIIPAAMLHKQCFDAMGLALRFLQVFSAPDLDPPNLGRLNPELLIKKNEERIAFFYTVDSKKATKSGSFDMVV